MSTTNSSENEVKRLRGIIERLGSMEAFTMSRAMKTGQDDELLARIDFARSSASRWRTVPATSNDASVDSPLLHGN